MLAELIVKVGGRELAVLEQELPETAAELEEQVLNLTQRAGRELLKPGLQQIADRTPAPCCCGRSMKNCGLREITVMTMCGEVIVQRRRYRCRCSDCHCELHPADARLCCGTHRVSKPLAKRVCQLAAVEHFTRMPELLAAQHGVTLCHETILELAHDVGGAAERMRLAEAKSSVARRDPRQVMLRNPPKCLYVSVDGIMYCTNQTEADPDHPEQKRHSTMCNFEPRMIAGLSVVHIPFVVASGKWQQMKVGCVYWQDEHEHWHKQMTWGRESPEEFAASLWRLAMQCGYGQAEVKIFAADGGAWCWDIHARYFSDATGVLDWYHASEHVWDAAKIVSPTAPTGSSHVTSSTAWAEDALTQLHDGGGTALIDWLRPQLATRRGHPRKAIEHLLSYVIDKQHHMNYPAAKAGRLQIGSGMIESTCKQLVGQRLKGPGMHWSEQGALAITALRATDLNGQWNSFWNTVSIKS